MELINVAPIGLHYPNVRFVGQGKTTNPIRETIMSLKNVIVTQKTNHIVTPTKFKREQVFFFVYNTDNYYHFVYDSLPHIATFLEIRKTNPDIKLLMNYPFGRTSHYRFVLEFLELLGIYKDDIVLIDGETEYSSVIVSQSINRETLYKSLTDKIEPDESHKKIYISRRSWIHGDNSNIGTNYTTRRKMVNENELVDYLVSIGYVEVFPELMSTKEKISLFMGATHVVGAIGGGLCNVLFSHPKCKLTAIISPGFLDVNERFLDCMNKVDLSLFTHTNHTETTHFKTNMRVQCGDIVGEICHIDGNNLLISHTEFPVAGWNSEVDYKISLVEARDCVKLDDGLNSPWKINLERFHALHSL